MLAVFCLRLAWGLVASLLFLSPAQVHTRFFRVQYLTALGLLAAAAFFLHELADEWFMLVLGGSLLCCLAGSIVWHLDGAPYARSILVLATAFLTEALLLGGQARRGGEAAWWLAADDVTSAALLGTSTTAMLVGHSYLVAPAMSLAPLLRSLVALGVALVVRLGLAGAGLWSWTAAASPGNLETETWLWLTLRWFLGFAGPVVLGWMAWETARIRSTQSATGILYVLVSACFLGELTSQLLLEKTGYVL